MVGCIVRAWGAVVAGGVWSVLLASWSGPVWAEPRHSVQREAEEAVQEALQREIYGLAEERKELLLIAAEKSPQYAPAMWHLGRVRDSRNRWVTTDDFIQQWTSSRKVKLYLAARDSAPDTVAGQMALAEYCRREGLTDQMRAALTRVLEIDPNHRAARQALGFVRMGPLWVSRQELQAEEEIERKRQESLTKWGRELNDMALALGSDSRARRAAAYERLVSLRDPSAIAAMEQIISPAGDEEARAVIDALGRMSDPEASLSLARHAIYYPSLPVREAAAAALSRRDRHSYVPALLDMMVTSVSSRIAAVPLPGGRIGYRHGFVRQTQELEEVLVLDTEYVRVACGGSRADATRRAALDAQITALAREWGVEQQNQLTQRLNERLAWVLNRTTNLDLPASPEAWWKWWNDQNERLAETKTQVVSQQYRRVQIVDPVPISGSGSGIQTGGGGGECFVAGTLVWTAAGPMPIEQVQRGDLVLSQNVETGELAFKPVLRTTTRPAGPIVKFTAGCEEFQCSGGHVFWVAGEGWRKASDLASGMLLHSVDGARPLSSVASGVQAETYNLVVADFATYFVGQQKILSHDFTMRKATAAIVPGLAEK
jgi:hypothetical protein